MTNLFFLWMALAIITCIIELGHPGLFLFLSLALGALLTACMTFATGSVTAQCTIFLLSSIISFALLRCWVRAHKGTAVSTNTNALQGKHAVVTIAIQPYEVGQVNVAGAVWSARSIDDSYISENKRVIIIGVKGCHLLVKED